MMLRCCWRTTESSQQQGQAGDWRAAAAAGGLVWVGAA